MSTGVFRHPPRRKRRLPWIGTAAAAAPPDTSLAAAPKMALLDGTFRPEHRMRRKAAWVGSLAVVVPDTSLPPVVPSRRLPALPVSLRRQRVFVPSKTAIVAVPTLITLRPTRRLYELFRIPFVKPPKRINVPGFSVTVQDPWDPDDDKAYTSRLDRDGNTVRAARPWVSFAADLLAESDLSTVIQTRPDRYSHRAVLPGWARTKGISHRLVLEEFRAGVAGGERGLSVRAEAEEPSQARQLARYITGKLDRDGNSIIPALTHLYAAGDAMREAELVQYGQDQDRFRKDYPVSGERVGLAHRIVLEDDGRAGESGGELGLVVWWRMSADGKAKQGQDQT